MIPPSPAPEEVAGRLVGSCDVARATGRRDAAILVVLARLGLRAQEVASLCLDDIDWRRGEMRVAGKGGKVEVLPLPVDVGEALVSYLSGGRPTTGCRAVFVKAVAPFGPMSSEGIGGVVRLSCERAGLSRLGPHRLRHLVATATLRAGASLAEVAQLLRHDSVATTGIYAVRRPGIRCRARPPLAGDGPMTATLEQAAEDYVTIRRSFGYKLHGHDLLLADFCAWLDQAGLDRVTVDAAVTWAVSPAKSDAWHAERLRVVRGFAAYLRALDPRCEVPPRDAIPTGRRRMPPHIYSRGEIGALMVQARLMSPPLRAATFETLIGLLAVTGMRSGEALRLDRNDVDVEAGTVMILATKFNKSRMLAIHPTTLAALATYADVRDRRWPQPRTPSFFVSNRGARLSCSSLYAGFAQLLNQAGLVPPTGSRRRRPRPHDLRHSFAVATLLEWYQSDQDVGPLLPSLSAWLGHAKPKDTYWYLSAVPELLTAASERAYTRRSQQR